MRLLEIIARLRRRVAMALEGPLAMARGREHIFLVITAIALGVVGAYGAIGFRFLISGVHHLSFGTGEYTLEILEELPWWRRLLMPTAGGLLVGVIVYLFAPEVKGSGIPEVMEAVVRKGGAIRTRVVLTKAAAAALTIGSGGSAGREGPIVHIGSALGSALGQLLQVSARRMRTFVACGAAAAIAATFNAPIAGALFAIEVVLVDIRITAMSPIVISSVVATVISRHHLGDFPAFDVPAYALVSWKELLLYAVLGLGAGLLAWIFIRVSHLTSDLFEKTPLPAWSRPAIGGLLVGVIALGLPHVFGVGYETINAALWGKASLALLGMVVAAKLVATSLTLGSGGSGGIFAPSLFLGATAGAAFGQLAGRLFPDWTADPGSYALVGMGALVSAATHAPITAILIIFELTNNYRIIPPLMLACVIGVLLSSQLCRDSIYTMKLTRRGVKLNQGRDINLLKSIRVEEVMEQATHCVPASMPLGELIPRLLAWERPAAILVDAEQRYLGAVELGDVREVLPQAEELGSIAVADDVADRNAPFVVPGDNLDLVMHLFGRTHREELPVCRSSEERFVVGVVTKRTVIDTYNRRIFQADLTGGFGSLLDAVREGRTMEVLGGVHLGEVDVPSAWVGKTLAECEPRKRHGLEVVLVHRGGEEHQGVDGRPGQFPSPDLEFEAGDRLLVMGSARAIRKLGR